MGLCGSSTCGCGVTSSASTATAINGYVPTIGVTGSGVSGDPYDLTLNTNWANEVANGVTTICTSSTRPTPLGEGQRIYETDTDRELVYDGTNWVIKPIVHSFAATTTTNVTAIGSTEKQISGLNNTWTCIGGQPYLVTLTVPLRFGTSATASTYIRVKVDTVLMLESQQYFTPISNERYTQIGQQVWTPGSTAAYAFTVFASATVNTMQTNANTNMPMVLSVAPANA